MKPICNHRGMTLIEIMAVIVIMGVLAGYAFVHISRNSTESQYVMANDELTAITSAMAVYVSDTDDIDKAFNSTDGLRATPLTCVDKYLTKPMSRMSDPWGNPYIVTVDDTADEVVIYVKDGETGIAKLNPYSNPENKPMERKLSYAP